MRELSLRGLPSIPVPQEIIHKAFKRAALAASRIRGPLRDLIIRREHRRIVVMASSVRDQLSKLVSGFPSFAGLPPFYRELVEATIDLDKLRKTLGAVNGTVTVIDKIKREQLRRLRYVRTGKEASAARREAYGRVSSVVKRMDDDLKFLRSAVQKLSDLPSVYLDMSTIVIAGYPNVGKSTLLKALTGSAPRIASYPFTTTGLQLGYFEHRYHRYQVIDTPGLLDRPLEKRNPIERKAIAALRYLAKDIVFMLDPSETCGYELKDQLNLLDDVKRMFEGIDLLVVVNKTDLLDEEKICQVRDKCPSAIFIAATTGLGIEELRKKLLQS